MNLLVEIRLMGDAADDMYDAALREEEIRSCLRSACPCEGWHWFQNEEGMYECRECGEVADP